MNCNDMEKRILLAFSGELSESEMGRINRHIAGCDDCRAYQARVEKITGIARRDLAVDGPSAFVTQRIISEAGKKDGLARGLYMMPAFRVLAYAAAAAIVAWFGFVRMSEPSVDSPDRLAELGAIISVISGEPQLRSEEGRDAALSELAERLLIMQGFIDDYPDPAELEYEVLSPTALLWHSIHVWPSKICV